MGVLVAIISVLLTVALIGGIIFFVYKKPLKPESPEPVVNAPITTEELGKISESYETPPQSDIWKEMDECMHHMLTSPSQVNKMKLAQAYQKLLCETIKVDSTQTLYNELDKRYKQNSRMIVEAVNENVEVLQVCDTANMSFDANYWYRPFMKNEALTKDHCRLLTEKICSEWERASAPLIMGKQKFEETLAWGKNTCGNDYLKCNVHANLPVKETPDPREGLKCKTPGDVLNTIEMQKQQQDQCVANFKKKGTELTDLQLQRNVDDVNGMCLRTQKYQNADDFGKLFPQYEWSVPQSRCPVCVASAPCTVNPSQFQSGLIGTLLGEAQDTGMGSIMPKFDYKEYC